MRSSFFPICQRTQKKNPAFNGRASFYSVFILNHIIQQSPTWNLPSPVQTKCSSEGYIYYVDALLLNLKSVPNKYVKFFLCRNRGNDPLIMSNLRKFLKR